MWLLYDCCCQPIQAVGGGLFLYLSMISVQQNFLLSYLDQRLNIQHSCRFAEVDISQGLGIEVDSGGSLGTRPQ